MDSTPSPPDPQPPGGLVTFTPQAVPRRYGDRVQLLATYWPLKGDPRSDERVRDGTLELVREWRARVIKLADAGWKPVAGDDPAMAKKRSYVMNCRPAFVITPQQTRCCRHQAVCPFCHARWVREVWESIDWAFFHDPAEPGKPRPKAEKRGLITRKVRYETPHRILDPEQGRRVEALPGLLAAQVQGRKTYVKFDGVLGAFETISVGYSRKKWIFEARQTLMVKLGFRIPHEWNAREARLFDVAIVQVVAPLHTVQPTRKDVMKAVAWTCRYSNFLLRGKPRYVAYYLGCREKKRTTATFGKFRNASERKAADEAS